MKREESAERSKLHPLALGFCLAISLAGATLLLFLGAVLATEFGWSDATIVLFVTAASAVAVLWGARCFAHHAGRQGLLRGVGFGLLYWLLPSLTGLCLFEGTAVSASKMWSLLLAAGLGAIGGIFGVGQKPKKRRKNR